MGVRRNWKGTIIIIIIWFIILFLFRIFGLFTDYWWFKNLNFEKIFLISLQTKIILFILSFAIFLAFALFNLWLSSRLQKSIVTFKLKLLITLVLSYFIGMTTYHKWFTVLQYLKQTPFNIADPIFMKDVSFYIFSLPFILAVWSFIMTTVLITLILVALDYLQAYIASMFRQRTPEQVIDFKSQTLELNRGVLAHLAILGSFVFILLAIRHYLSRFSIMYSEKGIVVGAGYTDVVAFLPIMKFLMILAVIIAVLFYIWIFFISGSKKLKKRHILLYAVILYIIVLFIGPTVIPAVMQSLKVSPNEINLEKPYIENNIEFTKLAYGLSDVEEKDFNVEQTITPETLEEASETIDNVRILDWRPLTQTYKQTQEIRLYYDLSGIDIDRYDINDKYTQVMLAPREMNQRQIVDNAKTWVNLHMVYTHGFGVVMSPVNSVTKEGLPDYFIQDIPPVANVDEENLIIENPRIYYGEKDNTFVLVNTNTKEFDFPKGNTNEYIQYDGKGGVQLDSFTKKLLLALKFLDIKILLSSDITKDSRIMFSRNIQDRISKITPFMMLDEDPYLVISEGRLYWIQDAYTISNNFPYSEKFGRINYIRNSVKVVVDAYEGAVTYYVVDPEDPLIQTYAKIFPKQFKSFDLMSEDLKKHIRYPVDLFKVQSAIYNTYHMEDSTVFYNKEDAWQIPSEIYGTGQQMKVEPYYIIIKLPEEEKEEFVLMTSFTPIRKDNMIAWMAARSDGENYGKLLLYKFPKEKLIYGPLQTEAKFDQDSEISQQLTLWSQQGSRVTRGNLLVIPIKDSLLYIEPLYIQAEQGQLPQLKRVLVSDGERVVMEETLEIALNVLFGKAKTIIKVGEEEKTSEELIADAQSYYDAILESMGKDWVAFGENFDKLGEVLRELS
ncbi:MAG: UPF0182 family protein [Nanoarchaeota archaeon]|nr:UPF0182 family protein [DPANN group archaeon]MBL7116402.1 UPF0182 family protein [Nanoarchaeota archaeon]